MADNILDRFTIGQGKLIPVDHTGPKSYTTGGETIGVINNMTGITAAGLGSIDIIEGSGSYSLSGNFVVYIQPTGLGVRKTFTAIWVGSPTGSGVTGVTSSGGTGMTVGTYALAFSGGGGSGAAGTITVLTATTTSTPVITNPGKGYTSAPTVTAATGGTPPTLTASITAIGAQVANGTNLSYDTVRLAYVGK